MRAFAKSASLFALTIAVAFGLAGVMPSPTRADLITGGTKAAECYIEFNLEAEGAAASPFICQDGDPTCDTDGCNPDGSPNDKCTINVALCLNQPNVSGCTPAAFKSTPKVQKNLIPVPATTGSNSACGSFTGVTVAVKVNKKGTKKKPKTVTIKASGTVTGKPKKDKDTLKLTCAPRTSGTCPTTTTTTTTVTTTTATTTTTIPCQIPDNTLGFTTTVGTTNCGGAGLNPVASAPFSGEIDSDVAGTTKITDLGLGCLYIGGGNATVIPPGQIPDGATNLLAVSAGTLSAVSATETCAAQCTAGAGPTMHCINGHCDSDADCDGSAGSCSGTFCASGTQATPLACTSDGDCGGGAGTCGLDANCFFGPPLPILSPPPFGSLTTCVMNVVQNDATGTVDTATGASSVNLPLSSRVYITGNTTSPCPTCVSSACTTGDRPGGACTPVGSLATTLECPPKLSGFQAPLPVTLGPLTTGPVSMTNATGAFCASQLSNGAFGKANAQRILETGVPGGDLTDGNPHASVLASVFCIPATGNVAVDGVADLPGPGAIGLNGNAQLNLP